MNYIEYLEKKMECQTERFRTATKEYQEMHKDQLKAVPQLLTMVYLLELQGEILAHRSTVNELAHMYKKCDWLEEQVRELTNECQSLRALAKTAMYGEEMEEPA